MRKVGQIFKITQLSVRPGFCPDVSHTQSRLFKWTGANTHRHTQVMGPWGWDTAETLETSMNLSSKAEHQGIRTGVLRRPNSKTKGVREQTNVRRIGH